mgnify:CR=1 FL=1
MDQQERNSKLISSYHRNLPHWVPPDAVFFVTFRLADSLPRTVLQELAEQREREREALRVSYSGAQQTEMLYKLDKKYFGAYDAWLDRCFESSPRWLAEPHIASLVADAIHKLDGKRYNLIAYTIMPNHAHLQIDTNGYSVAAAHQGVTAPYPLTDTLKQLKGSTARACNLALGRSGQFWHHESYDHVVRDAGENERIFWYILNNPVKAGLTARWEDWRWTYSKFSGSRNSELIPSYDDDKLEGE